MITIDTVINNWKEYRIGVLGGKNKLISTFINSKFFGFDEKVLHQYIIINQLKVLLKIYPLHYLDRINLMEDPDLKEIQSFIFAFTIEESYDIVLTEINKQLEVLKEIFKNSINIAISACHCELHEYEIKKNLISSTQINELQQMFDCPVFETSEEKKKNVEEPFYYFIKKLYGDFKIQQITNHNFKNPFENIKKGLNIGLFGQSVNITEFAFKFVYEDFSDYFYNEFLNKRIDEELTKIIEIENVIKQVSLIDSAYVDLLKTSYYSSIQAIIFFFNIDSEDSISFMRNVFNQFKGSENDIPYVIAANNCELRKNGFNSNNIVSYEKYQELENEFNCEVVEVSSKTGENIYELLCFLLKKIIQKTKTKRKRTKKIKVKK